MTQQKIKILSLALSALLLGGLSLSSVARDDRVQLVDQRSNPERGDSRNSASGATLVIGDNQLGRSLAERLADRLQQKLPFDANAQALIVNQGQLSLYIDGGFATPAATSLIPAIQRAGWRQGRDQLDQVRVDNPNGERRYEVVLAGEFTGRAFNVTESVSFRGDRFDARSRDQVINKALDAAVAAIQAAPPQG